MSCKRVFLLAVVLSYSFTVKFVTPSDQAARQDAAVLEPAPASALAHFVLPGSSDLQLIVELSEPSVVEYLSTGRTSGLAAMRNPRTELTSSQASSQRARLARQQREVIQALSVVEGARIEYSVETVLNAVIVRVPVEQYTVVRNLAGVKKVYFSRLQHPTLDTAAYLHDVKEAWQRVGGSDKAGAGVKIGIIDSGIDITNPMFVDNSLVSPPGFPKGETKLTNSKVIVARSFMSLLPVAQVDTAVDEDGHGTFVAGCAAGKRVEAPAAVIQGMAPGAFLGNYRVLGTPGVNDFTSTAAVIAAVNSAVADGMDILNLSLGELDYVQASENPEVKALKNAIAAGVVVVVSAGNDGPAPYSINNPGGMPEAITVGAATNSKVLFSRLHVTSPDPVPPDLAGVSCIPETAIKEPLSSLPLVDVAALDGKGTGCAPLPDDSTKARKVLLIAEGGCSDKVKMINASNAGASAIVFYSDAVGGDAHVTGDVAGTGIPAVMISNADGVKLKEFISRSWFPVTITLDAATSQDFRTALPRVLAQFSSRGPAADFSVKPDLVAVGQGVYSGTQKRNPRGVLYSTNQFVGGDGTSFAAPMVAGAAAVVKQLFPSFTPQAIKSALTTTASRDLTLGGTGSPGVLEAGSGLLDLSKAASINAVFDPTSLSFGAVRQSGNTVSRKSIQITNVSTESDEFTVTVEQKTAGPTISLSKPGTGVIPPGGSETVEVILESNDPATCGIGGFVIVQSVRKGLTYRIPYWAGIYAVDSSRVLTVRRDAGGTEFSTLEDAVAHARPGNTIEIADSESYTAGLTIGTNNEGLPLHGLIIRAAAGRTPTVIGSNNGWIAGFTVAGLRNVLLQGLAIRYGKPGIGVIRPSSLVQPSLGVDQCTITRAGDASTPGVMIDGASLSMTQSSISESPGTGFLAFNGAQITMHGVTVDKAGEFGVYALDSNMQILNSTVSNSGSAGAVLESCFGSIEGSTFKNSAGDYGDGIEIAAGGFNVEKCTLTSNKRAGIGFFEVQSVAPVGTVVRNKIISNSRFGVLATAGSELALDANVLEANGQGINLTGFTSALITNNVMLYSSGFSVGTGWYTTRYIGFAIYSGARGRVCEGNNSFFRNEGTFSRNEDTCGSNISDDNDLNSGSPFVDMSNGDYTPAPGIWGVDKGRNALEYLPFLDYFGRYRVATEGNSYGEGTVDHGAVEVNSTYPLVYPLLANGNQPLLGIDLKTGFAVLNAGTTPTLLGFSQYGASGELLTVTKMQLISPGAQAAILANQLFGFSDEQPQLGGVLAGSARKLAGFFLVFDRDFRRFSDGAAVSDSATTDLIMMRHLSDTSGKATYYLFNPGVNRAYTKVTLYASSGSVMGTPATVVIPAKGQYVFSFDGVVASSGYVRVRSDRPLSGLELFGNSEEMAALAAVPPGLESRLYFPHYAVNQGYTSYIGVINAGGLDANLVLRAFGDDGTELATVSRNLKVNAQLFEAIPDLFGLQVESVSTGYVTVLSDQGGLVGFTTFRYDDGRVRSAAAVPATSVPRQKLLFSHIAHQVAAGSGGTYQTGIALLNPFAVPAQYTIRVFNSAGVKLAEKTGSIGAGEKIAKILSHAAEGAGFFTQPLPLSGGHVEVTSDYGLIGFEWFLTEDLSQLASVPAQILK